MFIFVILSVGKKILFKTILTFLNYNFFACKKNITKNDTYNNCNNINNLLTPQFW